MAMKKNYNPSDIEIPIYDNWERSGFFNIEEESKKEPFCIMIPPPNVTGTLHMGHGFQNTLMDTIIRYKRMSGFDTLWQVGVDHAGIATQMVVERQLELEGQSKEDLGREAFEKKVWEWKESSGNKITKQLRRLGASPDWTREAFTMNEDLSLAVKKVFIKLYDEGLIYRGERLVNWDTVLQTALSDLEVMSEEHQGSLWYLKYPLDDKNFITVATTRPETMLGDTAIAVNPKDGRYNSLIGKKITLPLTGREVPVVGDEYVDSEFGTGCVKITPAHDFNDFEIGKRHNLEIINILNLDGTLNGNVPDRFIGLDRKESRKKVLKEMESMDLVEKIEPHKITIPTGDRSNSILEPLITKQWFINQKELSLEAVRVVKEDETSFVPKNWENTYFSWMDEIQDWCVSRQLWWGHRIPAWFDEDNNIFVAENEAEVRKKYNLSNNIKLKQDEDVLDTWFSSSLWTFSTLGWPSSNKLLKRYHPTNVLVTGFDIIFFWVARMIMMTTHFLKEVPFKKIFIHGLIKDSEGQKMSKSKGNTLDPLDIIDGIELKDLLEKRTQGLMQPKMKEKIEKQTRKEFPDGIESYGTDALRLTFCSLASGGRDINFDMKRVEGYRNFCNKLWNASRFIDIQLENHTVSKKESSHQVDKWITYKFNEAANKVERAFSEYRFDLATQAMYEFVWYEFCDWYIELTKIRLSDESISENEKSEILRSVLNILERALRLMHPIMPFITEEIWQHHKSHHNDSLASIMISPFPSDDKSSDEDAYQNVEWLKETVTGIRNIRGELNIKPSTKIKALLTGGENDDELKIEKFSSFLHQLTNLSELSWTDSVAELPPSAIYLNNDLKILIPLEGLIDPESEMTRLDKKIIKLKKEQMVIEGKLSNKKFTENAPEKLVTEQKKRGKVISNEVTNLENQLEEISKLI